MSTSRAVRLAIDGMRGFSSPCEAEPTEREAELQEAAAFALAQATDRRRRFLERRATEIIALKEEVVAYVERCRSHRPTPERVVLVPFVQQARRAFRTLRDVAPEDLIEELGDIHAA